MIFKNPKNLIFAIAAGIFIFPLAASAHVLKIDGSIGAILHIDPADSPVAGDPSVMHLFFHDDQNKFEEAYCHCQAVITENGKQIFSKYMFEDNLQSATSVPLIVFTFPREDVYTLIINGTPKLGYIFQNFSLSYDIRVDQQDAAALGLSSSNSAPTTGHNHGPLFIFIIIGLVVTYFLYIQDNLEIGASSADALSPSPPPPRN